MNGPALRRSAATAPPAAPPLVHRADWAPPDWLVPAVELCISLDPERSIVRARLEVVRNGTHGRPLRLDGAGLETLSVMLDGKAVAPDIRADDGHANDGQTLVLELPGDRATVETVVAVAPARNRLLYGLHLCGDLLLSQCEAEGFRRISWFPDRPDVLARFRVRLEADRKRFPVLLSNGNPGAAGPLPGGRHFAEWNDPHPKPCYLFAAVAGQLAAIEERFRTRSGREVRLLLWATPADEARGAHALSSLARAMAFDEAAFGREHDLDCHQLVAARDFAFGAMENKGLNIFNARYLLADPETATDEELETVSGVVAHEYFHNWSGNRVTCRDWFQLALKEGLTVWRDQCFTAAEGSAAVARIRQVEALEALQFPEDDGPLAHAVRPESYARIQNFYTATVYNKGAEIIRMIARVLGQERFRHGLDLYFRRHDGAAVTVEDFLACMAEAGLDAARFQRWYAEPGAPMVRARLARDPLRGEAVLRLSQRNQRPGASGRPLPIPLDIAILGPDGTLLFGPVLHLMTEADESLRLPGLPTGAVASINRGLSAPVRVVPAAGPDALLVLARHETDGVARHAAIEEMARAAVLGRMGGCGAIEEARLMDALGSVLDDWEADPGLAAELLSLPPARVLADRLPACDPAGIDAARTAIEVRMGAAFAARWWSLWEGLWPDPGATDAAARGGRRLRNVALLHLVLSGAPGADAAALRQAETGGTMTCRRGGIVALLAAGAPEAEDALAGFAARFQHVPDAMDKWFSMQAGAHRTDTVERVRLLTAHPAYDRRQHNRVQALFRTFGQNEAALFRADGMGIRLLANEVVRVDALRPTLAAGLVRPLIQWRTLTPSLRRMVDAALVGLLGRASRELADVVEAGL
jgi:aminopeptidase N